MLFLWFATTNKRASRATDQKQQIPAAQWVLNPHLLIASPFWQFKFVELHLHPVCCNNSCLCCSISCSICIGAGDARKIESEYCNMARAVHECSPTAAQLSLQHEDTHSEKVQSASSFILSLNWNSVVTLRCRQLCYEGISTCSDVVGTGLLHSLWRSQGAPDQNHDTHYLKFPSHICLMLPW